MNENLKVKIKDLNKKIKNLKLKRETFTLLGQSEKAKESEKAIYDLESELIKLKLDSTK